MNKPTVKLVPAHTNNYSKNIYPKTGIVLHWIVGSLASADRAFQDPNRKASTQYGIGKDGTIHQYVDDKYTAYHAGVSKYNQNYIGIEHEGGHLYAGERVKPSPECHQSSIRLVAWLCKTYNIPCNRQSIIKHSETGYATQCCGTLDIDYIVSEASKLLNNNMEIPQKTYDEARSGFNDLFGFFEAHGLRGDLAKYVKDGGDSVSWIIHNGRTELRGMFDVLVKERASLKASAAATELVLKAQNKQIADLQRELDESNQALANVEPTITELKDDVHTLTSERNTMKTAYDKLTVAYNKCIEGQKGNVNDYKEILTQASRALRKLLTRLYHLITKFNGRR